MDGATIVALPIGDKTITYSDGDTAPLHQTLVYLGDAVNISPEEVAKLSGFLKSLAADTSPVLARVCGKGTLGPDNEYVVLTESNELSKIRDQILSDDTVKTLADSIDQFPTWIPHVTGAYKLEFGDYILFNRLALWVGSMKETYVLEQTNLIIQE